MSSTPGSLTRNFPFPFDGDSYRYSANVEPAPRLTPTAAGEWGGRLIDVDEDYLPELAQRRDILASDSTRCVELPHMRPACWDVMLWGLQELARSNPEDMSLRLDGDTWHWRNTLLGIEQTFVYADDASLPTDPLRFIGGQVQEDLVLLDQREDGLWADAGLVTFASAWSMRFDLGMAFADIHRPVPRLVPEGIITRAEQFLIRLGVGQPYRRTNWTINATPRLDISTETSHEWVPARRKALASTDVGGVFRLRVEVQHFVRLAPSGAIAFPIRTYQLPFNQLVLVPEWRTRMGAVLAELPPDLADYKGLSPYRDRLVDWLAST